MDLGQRRSKCVAARGDDANSVVFGFESSMTESVRIEYRGYTSCIDENELVCVMTDGLKKETRHEAEASKDLWTLKLFAGRA